MIAQQEIEDHRPGKFGRVAKAAVGRVESTAEVLEGGVQSALIERSGVPAAGFGMQLELLHHVSAGLENFVVLAFPGFSDALQNHGETGPAMPIVRGEIGSTEERHAARREEYRHG